MISSQHYLYVQNYGFLFTFIATTILCANKFQLAGQPELDILVLS